MKIIARVLLLAFGLALFASPVAFAGTGSAQAVTHESAEKERKAYLKQSKKQARNTKKSQKKARKDWKKNLRKSS